MLTKDFGQRLGQARKKKGLSQKELGDKVGVGYQRISAYENGADIGLEMVQQLAAALNTPVEVLLNTNKSQMTPPNPSVEDALAIVEKRVRAAARFSPEAIEILLTLSPLQIQTLEENVLQLLAGDDPEEASEEDLA